MKCAGTSEFSVRYDQWEKEDWETPDVVWDTALASVLLPLSLLRTRHLYTTAHVANHLLARALCFVLSPL